MRPQRSKNFSYNPATKLNQLETQGTQEGAERATSFLWPYLHVRGVEIDLTELEDEQVVAIIGYRNVVAERRRVVTLSLIQDLVLLWHSGYKQLLAVVGGGPNAAGVPGETDAEGVDMSLASTVDRVYDLLRDALKRIEPV